MTESLLQQDNQETELSFEEKKSYYEELTGPGGKFYDPDPEVAKEKLARGKIHSDHYIPILEKRLDQRSLENTELTKTLNAGKNLQELIDQMAALQSTNSNSAPPLANEHMEQPVVDMNEIKSLIQNSIVEDRRALEEQRNLGLVQSKLIEKFGDNYSNTLLKQYKDLGLTPEAADQMARRAPQAVIKMLELDKKSTPETFQAPPQSGARRDNFGRPATEAKPWSWYQELRKRDPKSYNDKKTASQMERDYATLGADFEDGDFHS